MIFFQEDSLLPTRNRLWHRRRALKLPPPGSYGHSAGVSSGLIPGHIHVGPQVTALTDSPVGRHVPQEVLRHQNGGGQAFGGHQPHHTLASGISAGELHAQHAVSSDPFSWGQMVGEPLTSPGGPQCVSLGSRSLPGS